MKQIAALILFLLAAPAFAQQPPQLSPMEESCNQRISMEVSGNMRATTTIIELQRQLAVAQAKVREFEERAKKDEPKKD